MAQSADKNVTRNKLITPEPFWVSMREMSNRVVASELTMCQQFSCSYVFDQSRGIALPSRNRLSLGRDRCREVCWLPWYPYAQFADVNHGASRLVLWLPLPRSPSSYSNSEYFCHQMLHTKVVRMPPIKTMWQNLWYLWQTLIVIYVLHLSSLKLCQRELRPQCM